MFIEINDISTGTVINEPLNAYSINYVYGRQNDSGKYNLIYVLDNGLRKIEEFDSQSDLEDKIDEIKDISGGGAVANVYVYKGSCEFANLPASGNVVGDVWNITDDFELGGKSYPAGTNVAWDGLGWDALAGSIDLSNYYTKTEVNSLVSGALSFRGVYPNATNNPFVLQGKETGVYLICHTGNSPQNGPYFKATSSTSIYNLNLTASIGMYFLTKDYDSAAQSAEEPIGYFYSYENEFGSTTVNLVGQISAIVKLTNGSIISRVADTKSTDILRNILVSDKQQEITARKTFNVIPILKNGLTPTTDMQLVNKKYVDDNSVSFKPFTNAFPTTGTTQDFLTAVQALNLPTGNVYLGGVTFSDLPFSGNAEIEVYIYPNNVIFCILRSANVAPYIWSCNSHTYRGWEPVGQTIQYSTMPTADSSNADRIVEYVGATDANYTNGYFYKNIYTPASTYNLTEQQALDGITSVYLPENFTIDADPALGSDVDLLSEGSSFISTYISDSCDAYKIIYVQINTGSSTYHLSYNSNDGLYYEFDSNESTGTPGLYTLESTVTLDTTWEDYAGPVLLQEIAASYNWQQINVQPASDMSNYYTKTEIDSMLGDIQTVLETLTLPTAVEEELSEI